ncbi:hypothetical protein QBC46DRAFT_379061 [Diplogelasinospora grovesii]|uniref:SET domain-containing protein n=1 Tax=Diplogelasinospora grovesii TaxID=303347 RepID=A0AAN6NEW1_9PEZI|nr:hypothetical protein QBC46DRAFT_379061 [Diplogelasinospora grovesii]
MASHDGNTVFLSPQEAERIRNTVKDRLTKCSEVAGNVRETRDVKGSISQATGASLMADTGGAQRETLPALAVGQTYPPCTASLQDLQPMKLSDLKMETHHRGRKLTVKRASPVVVLSARSWTMVQDQEGGGDEIERLEVCLHKSRHGQDVLESASVIVIKEPYFTLTEEGEATLRIDHPSDLIIYRKDEISTETNDDVAAVEKLAKSCKDKGNTALTKGDLPLAHAHYTNGLKIARQDAVSSTSPDLARDLSRNRAHVNLLLNQLDEAIADSKAALIGAGDERSQELDSKAYFRAGCAAYNLGQYDDAKHFFEERLKLAPGNKEATIYLRNIEKRLREQSTGKYDLTKLRTTLSRARPRVDAANFFTNTVVKDSAGKGRGLFAARDIPAGDIVMAEKAFCTVWGFDEDALTAMTYDVRDDRIRVSPVGLTRSIVQKLLSNPSQIGKVMDLFGDYQGDNSGKDVFDGCAVVDTFRVHDIMSRNAFGPGSQFGEEGGVQNASTGLWIHAAYINHSCIANAKKEYIGDLMVLRAITPIKAGEEIFHSYDESSDYEARQEALMTTWGFECNCALCEVEKEDSPAVRKKRRDLATEADEFVEREHWSGAKRITIVKAQRLAKAIEETYDAKRYKEGVPRLATRTIQEWLAKASPRK